MTVLGSILPSEPSARTLAWQTVLRQLLEPLGPRQYRGIQVVAPISSCGGIVGGIWCSLLPKLPDRVNNKSQNQLRVCWVGDKKCLLKEVAGAMPSVVAPGWVLGTTARQHIQNQIWDVQGLWQYDPRTGPPAPSGRV